MPTHLTRTKVIRLIRAIVIVAAIIILMGYAAWRSYNYALGPRIFVATPSNGSAITEKTATIMGQAKRVNNLTLNGHPVSIDEQGLFSQTVIVFPGTNSITLKATDKFGRSAETLLTLFGVVI